MSVVALASTMTGAHIAETFCADAVKPKVNDPFTGAGILPSGGLGQIRAIDLDVLSNGNAFCLMGSFGVGEQLCLGIGLRSFRCYEAKRHFRRRAKQSLDAIWV
jgi:hypothetical protein